MIALDVEQGTIEWERARLGIPTSSKFGKILTPKQLKLSRSADGYLMELLAEWVTGHALEPWTSPWAERGQRLEPEARRAYEFEREVEVTTVGFCYRSEARLCGCSPDGLVGDDCGLELKCPAAKTHLHHLFKPDEFVEEHHLQVQGGLWVTGRKWWDLMSYYPGLPPVIVRVEPDEATQKALGGVVGGKFLKTLRRYRQKILDMGIEPRLGDDPTELPEWALPSVDMLDA